MEFQFDVVDLLSEFVDEINDLSLPVMFGTVSLIKKDILVKSGNQISNLKPSSSVKRGVNSFSSASYFKKHCRSQSTFDLTSAQRSTDKQAYQVKCPSDRVDRRGDENKLLKSR